MEGQRRNRAWWLAIGGKAWGNSTLPPTFLPGANAETGTHAELGDYCLLRGGVWITRKSGTSAPPEPFTSTPPTTSTLPHPGALSEPFHSADHFLLGGAFSPLYHVTLGLPGLMWSLSSADTVQQPQPPAFITRPPQKVASALAFCSFPATAVRMVIPKCRPDTSPQLQACTCYWLPDKPQTAQTRVQDGSHPFPYKISCS